MFGPVPAAGTDGTLGAWSRAWQTMTHFTGDPIAELDAVADDDSFLMGPVVTLCYRILAGMPADDAGVTADTARVTARRQRATGREARHADAVLALARGEFLDAATAWHRLALDASDDFVAIRMAHDVCLHIGDDSIRLPSALAAVDTFPDSAREHGLVRGMASFALGEVGRYDEAELHGRASLVADPDDTWARHALAHVYESTGRHEDALEVLCPGDPRWPAQNLLANHMWWHLAIRRLHNAEPAAAMDLLDRQLTSTTAFGLADATALLWRVGLDVGGDGRAADPTGHRWLALADAWATSTARHTCAFLDLHQALAYAAVPDHPAAESFWTGALDSHREGTTYNDETFRLAVVPVVVGLRALAGGDRAAAADGLRESLPALHRIGGSVLQRDIVHRTLAALDRA